MKKYTPKFLKNTYLPWLMWILAACFYCYEFFLQVSPSVMVSNLMQAFSINAVSIGILASLYFYAYAIMQIPAGVLLDRFGARTLLTAATLICALGAFLFAATNIFTITAIGRLLIGLGSAFAAIGCMYIAANNLPTNRFSLLTGLMVTIGMLGAINGQAPLAIVVKHLTWRPTMLLLSAIGILASVLMWTIIRDQITIKTHEEFVQAEKKLLQGLKHILRSQQTWVTAIYAGLMFTPTLVFGSLWGTPFLKTKFAIDNTFAATISSMLYFGWIFGAPIIGGLSDYFKRRKLFINVGCMGTMISLAIIIYAPINTFFAGALLFLVGFCSSSLILGFSIVREINPPEDTGAAIGFMNCINMLGGAFIPPVIGYILDHHSINRAHKLQQTFSLAGYQYALAILIAVVIASWIIQFFLHETYARETYQSK